MIFEHQDLEMFTGSFLCYIKNCIDTVHCHSGHMYPGLPKPKALDDLKGPAQQLKERNTTFKSSNRPTQHSPSIPEERHQGG